MIPLRFLFSKRIWRRRSVTGILVIVLAVYMTVTAIYLATSAYLATSTTYHDNYLPSRQQLLHHPLLKQQQLFKRSTSKQDLEIEQQQLSVQLLCRPEDDWKEKRYSSQPYTAPDDIPSIFNCQHPATGGHCRYFYPSNFFDPKCGVARDYAYMVTETEDRLRKRQLWKEGPRISFSIYSSYFKVRDGRRIQVHNQRRRRRRRRQKENETLYMERISYVHVHKAGGTSMKHTLETLANKGFGSLNVIRWFYPRATLEIDQSKYKKALEAFHRAVRYPKVFDKVQGRDIQAVGDNDDGNRNADNEGGGGDDDDHDDNDSDDPANEEPIPPQIVFYTLVRDPVSRFISSIGQVMGSFGSKGPLAKKFRTACLKQNAQETLACCMKYVKSHSLTGFELHFAPQALDIAFSTFWQDIPVAVFNMEESLTTVLQTFSEQEVLLTKQQSQGNDNEDSVVDQKQRRTAATATTTTMPILNRRNGTKSGYRPDPVLTQMSVKDFNSTLLQEVCEMYKVDVIMLQSLGYSTRCDHSRTQTTQYSHGS